MQDSLTFLYDLVLGIGGTYLGLGFIIGVVDLWKKCSPDYAGQATEEATAQDVETSIDQTAVPLELPASAAVEMDAIALPELKSQEREPELEPLERADEQTASQQNRM